MVSLKQMHFVSRWPNYEIIAAVTNDSQLLSTLWWYWYKSFHINVLSNHQIWSQHLPRGEWSTLQHWGRSSSNFVCFLSLQVNYPWFFAPQLESCCHSHPRQHCLYHQDNSFSGSTLQQDEWLAKRGQQGKSRNSLPCMLWCHLVLFHCCNHTYEDCWCCWKSFWPAHLIQSLVNVSSKLLPFCLATWRWILLSQ